MNDLGLLNVEVESVRFCLNGFRSLVVGVSFFVLFSVSVRTKDLLFMAHVTTMGFCLFSVRVIVRDFPLSFPVKAKNIFSDNGAAAHIVMVKDFSLTIENRRASTSDGVFVRRTLLLLLFVCRHTDWAVHVCNHTHTHTCLLYTSPSPRDFCRSRMPSSA